MELFYFGLVIFFPSKIFCAFREEKFSVENDVIIDVVGASFFARSLLACSSRCLQHNAPLCSFNGGICYVGLGTSSTTPSLGFKTLSEGKELLITFIARYFFSVAAFTTAIPALSSAPPLGVCVPTSYQKRHHWFSGIGTQNAHNIVLLNDFVFIVYRTSIPLTIVKHALDGRPLKSFSVPIGTGFGYGLTYMPNIDRLVVRIAVHP